MTPLCYIALGVRSTTCDHALRLSLSLLLPSLQSLPLSFRLRLAPLSLRHLNKFPGFPFPPDCLSLPLHSPYKFLSAILPPPFLFPSCSCSSTHRSSSVVVVVVGAVGDRCSSQFCSFKASSQQLFSSYFCEEPQTLSSPSGELQVECKSRWWLLGGLAVWMYVCVCVCGCGVIPLASVTAT